MALATGLVILLTAGSAAAQLEDALSGVIGENAKGYLKPLPSALSGTMNAGIFRSGSVPLVGLNFSVSIEGMVVSFDDDDRTYRPADPPGFTSVDENPKVPTVIGDEDAVLVDGAGGTTWGFPGGFDLEHFGLVMPQFTIGSVAGTKAVIRWIPPIDLGDSDLGKLSLFGIGAQHSVSKYFPTLPVSVAAGIFYQTFEVGDIVKTSAIQLNVTGSKSFGIVEPYAGLGFDSFDMEAEYTYSVDDEDKTITVDFDKETNMHLTVGANLKIPGLSIFTEYNIAAVNGYALGLSFGM